MARKPVESLDRVLAYLAEDILFPYQMEWVTDESRFKICCKARQIGISECLGLEGALDVLRGESVFFVSRTENQSIYLLDKFYKWMEFFIAGGVGVDYQAKTNTGCKINGVDVRSLTSNAVAGEGFTGNVYLDEFSLHENDEQIYRSLFPTITWGYKIRLVSRPRGQSNKFYEIWSNPERYPDYRRHKFDINRALSDGLPIDLGELRRNLDDEGFRENYLCEFIDESTSFFPYVLLRSAIGATRGDGDYYLGMDLARRRDATVICVVRKLGDFHYVEDLQRLKGTRFSDQKEAVREVIERYHPVGGRVDATGLGMQFAEELTDEFPQIGSLMFTHQNKQRMVTRVKRLLEDSQLEIPDDEDLINACHSIKKTTTASNNVIFDAARTAEGHADDFWALALALDSTVDDGRIPSITVLEYQDEPADEI